MDSNGPNKPRQILFVCTGNSCRSVMAEAIFKTMAAQKNLPLEILSAGVSALPDMGASNDTIEVLKAQGMDASRHRARRLTREMIKSADLIFVMEDIHQEAILEVEPGSKKKVFMLSRYCKDSEGSGGIPDPVGRGVEYYESVLALIQDSLDGLANEFVSGRL